MMTDEDQPDKADARRKEAPTPEGEAPGTPAAEGTLPVPEAAERESDTEEKGAFPDLEDELDVYPLREPAEDPRWALWIVWPWIGIALGSIAFILVLLILGWYYD